jgi:hypothetical protein
MQPLHDNSGPKGHLAVLVILQICRTRQPSEVGTQSDEDPAKMAAETADRGRRAAGCAERAGL